jgi:hypothetical protein
MNALIRNYEYSYQKRNIYNKWALIRFNNGVIPSNRFRATHDDWHYATLKTRLRDLTAHTNNIDYEFQFAMYYDGARILETNERRSDLCNIMNKFDVPPPICHVVMKYIDWE